MGNSLSRISNVFDTDIELDIDYALDIDVKPKFNNVLLQIHSCIIKRDDYRPDTLIYGVNNESIIIDGLYTNSIPLNVVNENLYMLKKRLPLYENYYHIILLDRYHSYYYTNFYIRLNTYNFLSKPHIYNVQLRLDIYVINHIYNYIHYAPHNNNKNMNQVMSYFYHELKRYMKNDYITTTQDLKYFKNQIKYILIVLNELMKKNNKKYVNHSIWMNHIAPYLM